MMMEIAKLFGVIFWICDSELDVATILLHVYYIYIEVLIKVANTGSTLAKLNVSCKINSSSVK